MSEYASSPEGIAAAARGRTALSGKAKAAGVLAIIAAGVGLGAYAIYPKAKTRLESHPSSTAAWGTVGDLPMPAQRAVVQQEVAAPAPQATPAPAPPVEPPSPVAGPTQARVMGFWEDKAASDQAAHRAQQQRQARIDAAKRDAGGDPDVATPSPGNRSEYAGRMQTTSFGNTEPTPHHFHHQYTLKKNTMFPCVVPDPISSMLPGPVTCVVDENVLSMDGNTILLPKGTEVNGTIEHGLSTGDKRLFMVWTDALTPRPDLLPIPLDAPAADQMGQIGVPGEVDTHLWEKLQTALLLTVVNFGGQAAVAAAQAGRGNTNLNFGSLANQGEGLAQIALGNNINIPPTLYRRPGYTLTVRVNKYIDLYKFYQNKAIRR